MQTLDAMLPTLAQRPRTRGDCEGGERPCPWIGCAHHLLAEAASRLDEDRVLELLDELPDTCVLDVADRGGETLEGCGARIVCTAEHGRNAANRGRPVTKEFARQVEGKALRRLARRPGLEALAAGGAEPWAWAGRSGAEPEPPGGVERPYRSRWSPTPKTTEDTETIEEESTVERTIERKTGETEAEEESTPAAPLCGKCGKAPRIAARKNTPPAQRTWCKRCRVRARQNAWDARRSAAAKAAPALRPQPAAPRPTQAPAPVAQDFASMLAHAQRCIAACDALGGVERAERIAEALA